MAAFASGRRSPGIRFFVVLLALIMAFASVSLPVYALSESVALFGLAAVLSAATAALGFKLTNNQQGIDTINRMCADFIKSALAPALVVIGTRVNGLQNDMAYIKMQVANAKTYLDERVLAWVQQWLGQNGVYNTGSVSLNNSAFNDCNTVGEVVGFSNFTKPLLSLQDVFTFYDLGNFANTSGWAKQLFVDSWNSNPSIINYYVGDGTNVKNVYHVYNLYGNTKLVNYNNELCFFLDSGSYSGAEYYDPASKKYGTDYTSYSLGYIPVSKCITNFASTLDVLDNSTGLSGSDTLGEDYVNKTLEQILQGLKDHAPDWYDAGADSSTNSTVGAKDLPVTVPAGAATENPALNPDAVYNPSFDQPLDDTRSGSTSSTAVADGVTNANTAESSEAAAATVTETQTIIDSLINWANNYISPEKGLFSKFPLCIPYDVYLLVSSALGVDARDISDIVNADTSDIGNLPNDSAAVNPQSDFVPVVDIQHDFNLDGYTYPIRISFDLTPYEPLIKINRIFLSIALIAELIGSEYKRIRWGK